MIRTGTVALATVRGVPAVRVMRTNATEDDVWWVSAVPVKAHRMHSRIQVKDVAPQFTFYTDHMDALLRVLNDNGFMDLADSLEGQR